MKDTKTTVDSAGAESYNNAYATSGIIPDQTQWNTDQVGTFLILIEVFVDDFINLAKKKSVNIYDTSLAGSSMQCTISSHKKT